MNRGEFVDRMRGLLNTLHFNAGTGYRDEATYQQQRDEIYAEMDRVALERAETIKMFLEE